MDTKQIKILTIFFDGLRLCKSFTSAFILYNKERIIFRKAIL